MLTDDEVIERFTALRQHQKDGKRSPHKPLLVLTALGRLAGEGTSVTRFSQLEEHLSSLINTFGPPSRTGAATSAAYPFTRLRTDGIWELDADVPMDVVGPLQASDVSGRFTPPIEEALRSSRRLVNRVARMLVDSQFPDTLAGDVLLQAGLDPDLVLRSDDLPLEATPGRSRSRAWVIDILHAWDRSCAFCGYDGQLGSSIVGIEAAHIRWFNLGGPDAVDNGLALCALHHKLFDRGALGIDDGYRVKVSNRFTGRRAASRSVYELHGVELLPRPGTSLPGEEYVVWHNREVFKGEALSA
jgi:putative restriction endonuclease